MTVRTESVNAGDREFYSESDTGYEMAEFPARLHADRIWP